MVLSPSVTIPVLEGTGTNRASCSQAGQEDAGAHFNAEILIFLVASSFSGSETFQFLCVLEGSLPGLCALLPGDPKLLLGVSLCSPA